jgi:hypothetical protein
MKVKVRGIYSTAISKLLLDSGVEITQAADAIKTALNISGESAPTITIEDIDTKEGVYVYGTDPVSVIDILKKHLKNSVFYKEEMGRIYCGIIKNVDQKSKSIIISLPDEEEGVLDMKNFWGYVKPGTKLLIQSKGTYDGRIMLSTQLRIFGEDVIIIKNGFTKTSRGIRSDEGRDKLHEIASSMDLKDWGILWVQGAESKEESVLRNELTSLIQKENEITERFNACSEPTVLYEGLDKYFTIFSKDDKMRLDIIRKKVMPTIPNHHSLKSAGYTILTDFAEALMDKSSDEEMLKKVNETLLRYGPSKNKLYRLAFTRLNGTSYRVEGILEDIVIENGEVKSLTVVNRGDWGGRSYYIDTNKNYVTVKRTDSEDRVLTMKPEIFPKFAKITTFDVVSKNEGGNITVSNSDRIEKLFKRGEIGKEYMEELVNTIKELGRA